MLTKTMVNFITSAIVNSSILTAKHSVNFLLAGILYVNFSSYFFLHVFFLLNSVLLRYNLNTVNLFRS